MHRLSSNPVWRFVDSVLRGVGQVMLQNNVLTGLLFLVGIFISSWVAGLYALLGTGVSTATALLFGARRADVVRGLYGFNGTLTALGLAVYLHHDATLLVYVIVASVFSTLVMAALAHAFGAAGRALTAPFVITTWIFVGAVSTYARLHGTVALGAPHLLTGALSSATVLRPADAGVAILNGVAQVMLQQNVWTGAVFLLAIAVNSRISCAAAVLGSAVAAGIAWSLGAEPIAIRAGLFGFNAVLTAIALGGILFLLHRTTVLLAVLAVCVSTILYGTWMVVFSPLGLPVVTAPFVATTWLCLLATRPLARLQALAPADPATPEQNLLAAKQT